MDIPNIIGKNLKSLRKEYEITQVTLCKATNIEQSTLAGYETGKNTPKLDILLSLANYFNVTLDYLVGRSEIKTSPVASLAKEEEAYIKKFRELNQFNKEIIIGKTNELIREQRLEEKNAHLSMSNKDVG